MFNLNQIGYLEDRQQTHPSQTLFNWLVFSISGHFLRPRLIKTSKSILHDHLVKGGKFPDETERAKKVKCDPHMYRNWLLFLNNENLKEACANFSHVRSPLLFIQVRMHKLFDLT